MYAFFVYVLSISVSLLFCPLSLCLFLRWHQHYIYLKWIFLFEGKRFLAVVDNQLKMCRSLSLTYGSVSVPKLLLFQVYRLASDPGRENYGTGVFQWTVFKPWLLGELFLQ